jgi:uncharacterized protein YjiS (DUF1127 family)
MSIVQMAQGLRWRGLQRRQRSDGGWIALLKLWRRRAYDRQMLVTMSDAMLRDIGITRCDAMNEASKPFWRA